eukprot:Nk52_evm8s270 gene=Nk52_evmTU8s270
MISHVIDGSLLEGGGQVLRISVGLSCLMGGQLKIHKIRAARSKPGLKPQHLSGLNLVARMGRVEMLTGNEINSTEIALKAPGLKSLIKQQQKETAGQGLEELSADPGTAGSIALLFQISLPLAVYLPGHTSLRFKGGTRVQHSPTMDYVEQVLRPNLRQFGVEFESRVEGHGYYPKGGGSVLFDVGEPGEIRAITREDSGVIESIHVQYTFSGRFPKGKVNSTKQKVTEMISEQLPLLVIPPSTKDGGLKSSVRREDSQRGDSMFSVTIVAHTSTGCVLGASYVAGRSDSDEDIAHATVDQFLSDLQSGACVDSYMQDQIVIYMCLAKGRSVIRTNALTSHSETAIRYCSEITGAKFHIEVDNNEQRLYEQTDIYSIHSPITQEQPTPSRILLTCEGIGF